MRNLISCTAILLVIVLTGSALAEWTTPVPVTAGINTSYDEWTPFLSNDGLSLYFSELYTNTSFYSRIFEAKRSQPSGQFTSVQEVLSTPNKHVISPWVSPDNLRMYYHEEGSSSWLIKMSTRASVNGSWSQGTAVSGLPSGVCFPSLSSDELTIVYNNPSVGNWDMYIATRPNKNSSFSNIRNLNEINTDGLDQRPFLSSDARGIYWSNGGQIFEAMRSSLNDPFGNVQHLSAFDIPGGYSAQPAISSDGTAFYFAGGLSDSRPDIYVSYNVPEPATLMLIGFGGFMLRKRKT
jgi:hypothetical protein